MPVPSTITDISQSSALNSPAGSDQIAGTLDDYLRAIQAIVKGQFVAGSPVASASTLSISADRSFFDVTGTATIQQITACFDGRFVILRFAAGITLQHSSALKLPGGANITTAADDAGLFVQTSSGSWTCVAYSRPQDADKLDGQHGSYYADIPARLGYTPVQQGTGVGQSGNAIKLGFGAGKILATVDNTNFGAIALESWALSNAGGTISGALLSSFGNAAPSSAANYSFQSSGSFGGGYAIIDGANAIGIYSSGGTLNIGFGGLTSIASKLQLTSSGNLTLSGSMSATGLAGGAATGTGASGTWGINISGNAATATSATSATTATTASSALSADKLSTASGSAPCYGARAFVNFNGTGTAGTNQTLRSYGNVSSVLKNGTGDYTINFTADMPDTNYCVTGSAVLNGTGAAAVAMIAEAVSSGAYVLKTTSAVRVVVCDNNTDVLYDPVSANVVIMR